MTTYLDKIIAAHRAAAAADFRSPESLRAEAQAARHEPRGFRRSLLAASEQGVAVIAEVKRRSPSRGDLAPQLETRKLVKLYAKGGASAVSVLTDEEFFGGSRADLEKARGGCKLPVLRKDFTVCEADVFDARAMGADAVLLIVAALSDKELFTFQTLARELDLDALVEVHDRDELSRALDIGADLVGVNQRDLSTFEVDADRAEQLAEEIPAGVVRVAESGISGPGDVSRLAAAGYHAILVGESLVTADDPRAAVEELVGAGRREQG